MTIRYSDGDAIESRILGLLRDAPDLRAQTSIALEHYESWAVRYHLCPERANLVRHLNWTGLDVLELGAGMGGVSRYLAENAASLTVVEGTQARFDALSARLRDLSNWTGTVSNIQDYQTSKRFDVVCVIGVFEYSELYVHPPQGSGDTPFTAFLKKAREFLKPDGVLVLAIENQLGLKYWSGAAEDHTGRLFDGICGYPTLGSARSPRTFSRRTLQGLLKSSGFLSVDEYFPFPDYKIPTSVVSEEVLDLSPALASGLASDRHYDNYTTPRIHYFPPVLAAQSLAEARLLGEMSNSFLFCATDRAESAVRKKLLSAQIDSREVAWHYSNQRRVPVVTRFVREQGDGGSLVAKKSNLARERDDLSFEQGNLRFVRNLTASLESGESVRAGDYLRSRWVNLAYFENWDPLLEEMRSFLSGSLDRWRSTSSHGAALLRGEALDAVFTNAVRDGNDYVLFNQEWRLEGEMPASWFVFRNVFVLSVDGGVIPASAPFGSLRGLYEQMCTGLGVTPDFDGDAEKEARFQFAVTPVGSVESACARILADLAQPLGKWRLPRDPAREEGTYQYIQELQRAHAELTRTLATRPHQWASKVSGWVRRYLK